MARLTKKEKEFCAALIQTGSISSAQRLAGIENGRVLLCRQEIIDEIKKLSEARAQTDEYLAKAALRHLAAPDISDAVSLIFKDGLSDSDLKKLDLFAVSEIRRRDNVTEIKFFDRFKAIERLLEAGGRQEHSVPFYEALLESARGLSRDGDED